MGKTLFITDLDGTLLNKNAEITPVTAKIINGLIDGGMIFTYATARSLGTAAKVTGKINFKYPAVHNNGVFVQNPKDGDYISKCVFDRDKITEVLEICENNSFNPIVFAFIDGRERFSWLSGRETDEIKTFLEERKDDNRRRAVNNYSEIFYGGIYDFTFLGKSYEELRRIADILNLNEHFSYVIQEDTYKNKDGNSTYFFSAIRFDAGKDAGVLKVKELAGADKIVCFGDNVNDIPMFNVSDEKYAVKNAVDEIKNIATAVIGSNDSDGVARWLEKNAHDYF
jgi:Cof subfamily protein (haloacid dehalogenase superfamily)